MDIPDRYRLKGAERLGPIQRLLSPQSGVNDIKVCGHSRQAPLGRRHSSWSCPPTASWRLKPTRGSSLRPPSHDVDLDARTITARQLLLPSRAPSSEETGTQTGPREFGRKHCLKLVAVNIVKPLYVLVSTVKVSAIGMHENNSRTTNLVLSSCLNCQVRPSITPRVLSLSELV